MTNIAVFASGNGSNAVNLVKAFNAGSRINVALCLTDKENAPVIEKMKDLGVETIYFPRSVWKENPQSILDTLRAHDIKVIALAGFLCFLSDEIVDAYEGRILNIHPSLLPAYGGKGMHGSNVHKAVIEAGDTRSGATVHVVTKEIDAGPIVVQREVAVLPDDTPESLEAKVHEVEYMIFPEAVVKTVASLKSDVSVSMDADAGMDAAVTPPPVPKSVDDAWAEALGVPNNVPPVPEATVRMQEPGIQNPIMEGNGLNLKSGISNQAYGNQTTQEPMPPTYLVWSVIITILCCFIPGIVAIINSAQVSSKYYQGDIDGARRASERAQIWIIISFVLGVIINTLYLPLMIAGGL
ncbi:MAG: phosphoribosylglycinamide formyltransferase [Muribaculaceae bacterium]|nr:phosphoribosylglycinamide formyltransferase [Muribaculaceae bacterium]